MAQTAPLRNKSPPTNKRTAFAHYLKVTRVTRPVPGRTISPRNITVDQRNDIAGERKQTLLRRFDALPGSEPGGDPDQRTITAVHANRVCHQIKLRRILTGYCPI